MQASIDVLAELGYLSSMRMMISLMQSIKQARWPEDGLLSQLPGVVMDRVKNEQTTLQDLREMDRGQLMSLARRLGVDRGKTDDVYPPALTKETVLLIRRSLSVQPPTHYPP